MPRIIYVITFLFIASTAFAQQGAATTEDSLTKGFKAFMKGTTIGGYGNAFYQRDFNRGTSVGDLERFVLFIGHKFNKNISLFSELEVEDAKITGNGIGGGEVSVEQCYIKFDLNPKSYIVAGLFIPRIGIMK